MLNQIISHTPAWVWGLFALLLWLGIKQALPGSMGLRRVALVPVAMTALSLYGTVSAFGTSPQTMLAWLVAACTCATLVLGQPLPPGIRFDAASQRLQMPGSWVPLALMMGIFTTKYFVGASVSMHAAYAGTSGFAIGFATLYGAFSGLFIARAVRLLRLALDEPRTPIPSMA
jgi:hypothetical protein